MNARSKLPLFLMEVVIMLLVFALSASVCLKVFAEGKKIATESCELDKACMEVQKVAEYWQSTKGNPQETARLMQAEINGDGFEVFYDEEWSPTEKAGIFTLSMQADGTTADIVMKKHDKVLFSIKTKAVIYGA